MKDSIKTALGLAGADVEGALVRFMDNENIYEKFLKKLLQDRNLVQLGEKLEVCDYEGAAIHAHTLKGVVLNLGLDMLANPLIQIMADIREGKYDQLNNYYDEIQKKYKEFCNIMDFE